MQDGLFSASYSGATQPISPAAFLHAWWRHADHHLASYQQQDAHEFYLYALAGLGQPRPLPDLPQDPPVSASAQLHQQAGLLQQQQQGIELARPAPTLQQQLPAPEQGVRAEECMLVPSQLGLHACLAEPLHPGRICSRHILTMHSFILVPACAATCMHGPPVTPYTE